jgi:fibronectin type 3 domain-containing protein
LSWSACTGASSYNVYRGTAHGGPYNKIIAGAASASAIDQNAQHAATYYYVVTAINSQVKADIRTKRLQPFHKSGNKHLWEVVKQ